MNEDATTIRRRAVMTRALLRSAARLGLRREQLAAATGLALHEIAAFDCDARRLDPDDPRWGDCVLLIRLCKALEEFAAGDPVAMRTWMLEFNDDLQDVPAGMLGRPRQLADLVTYLERCRAQALGSAYPITSMLH
ncbi:MAG: hypothetical protein LC632_01490 [Xanthomonadaceae bacterium]|nr:hypothetical protein [Xanthomonadaceae bacterium]